MLIIPVLAAVALAHRNLQIDAPTSVLSRKVRRSAPTLRTAAGLLVLALALLTLMHALATAIELGAPAWLNLVVLVLAWDFIKIGILTIRELLRTLAAACRRMVAKWVRHAPRTVQ